MTELTQDAHSGQKQISHLSHSEAVTAGSTTDPVFVSGPPSVCVDPGTGVTIAAVEYTITSRTLIESDVNNAVWVPWDKGDIAEADGPTADSFLGPITAVRCSSTGGTTTFEVLQHADG